MKAMLTNGQDHETSRNREGEREATVLVEAVHVVPQNRREEGGDQASGVNGEIEQREEPGQLQLLLGQDELVASEGGDAGFDTSRAEGDERQPEYRELLLRETYGLRRGERQEDASHGVYHGYVEYRLELAQVTVR